LALLSVVLFVPRMRRAHLRADWYPSQQTNLSSRHRLFDDLSVSDTTDGSATPVKAFSVLDPLELIFGPATTAAYRLVSLTFIRGECCRIWPLRRLLFRTSGDSEDHLA
jgi:hypothetical protein